MKRSTYIPEDKLQSIMKNAFLDTFREAVAEELLKQELEDYEKRVRAVIEPIVASISIRHVSTFMDHMRGIEDFRLFLNIFDGEKIKSIPTEELQRFHNERKG